MKKRMTIRTKITLANILILIIASVILSVASKFSAQRLIAATPVMQAVQLDEPIQQPLVPIEDTMPIERMSIESVATYKNSINFYMVAVIVLGGVATHLIMKKLLRSLEDLEKQIDNITIDNLSHKIQVKDCEDEILRITDKFNNMTDKLNDSFETQKRFSQSAAHELRTPLTVIRTKLDVFRKKKDRGKEEYETLIDSMRENTERLSNIVESLLNLTNFNEVDMDSEINIDKVINKVLEHLNPYAKEKDINIIHEKSDISILGNEPLLYRCFYNLIENGIIYNEGGGYLKITSNNINNQTTIFIEDSGVGIPKNLKENIFEPFFRVDKSRSRKLGGSGLGLSIVKEIIKKHNGNIDVYDNNPKGTVFEIKINNLN